MYCKKSYLMRRYLNTFRIVIFSMDIRHVLIITRDTFNKAYSKVIKWHVAKLDVLLDSDSYYEILYKCCYLDDRFNMFVVFIRVHEGWSKEWRNIEEMIIWQARKFWDSSFIESVEKDHFYSSQHQIVYQLIYYFIFNKFNWIVWIRYHLIVNFLASLRFCLACEYVTYWI